MGIMLGGSSSEVLAFPSAVGFGKNTVGGRGGSTIKVTNLNNSGSGSFREAMTTSGARIVVFDVSGHINLTAPLSITNGNVTVAGQTSPGGICITGDTTTFECEEVIVRHMRFRVGSHGSSDAEELDSLDLWGQGAPSSPSGNEYANLIIDHCSIGWGVDENFSTAYELDNVTIQKCMVHEGLTSAGHPKGNHSKGLFIWGRYSPNMRVTLYRNSNIHNYDRVPLINTGIDAYPVVADCVNNVSYNHFGSLPMGTEDRGVRVNWRHNYTKEGPGSNSAGYEAHHWTSGSPVENIYMIGNIGRSRATQGGSEWRVHEGFSNVLISTDWQADDPWDTAGLVAETMTAALAQEIVEDSGVTVPSRDSVEDACIADYIAGDGSYRTDVTYPDDYPTYSTPSAPTDTSGDGIPDSWATANGLNPATNYEGVSSPNGYDWVERYINDLAGD